MTTKSCVMFLLAVGLSCALMFSTARAEIVLLQDTFDSASATRLNDANDAYDADWWMVNRDMESATLTTDVSGINSGNALSVNASNSAVYPSIWANLPSTTLASAGDYLQLSFDVRVPDTTTEKTFGFRFGLYSTGSIDPPSADKTDDYGYLGTLDGYMFYVSTGDGTAAANSAVSRRETDDNWLLSTTAQDTANFNSDKVACELDSSAHEIVMKLLRTTDGVEVTMSVDGTVYYDNIDNFPGYLTTFDGVALAQRGAPCDFLLDNVTVTTNVAPVPEPSTLAMLVAGLLGLLAYAWRKRN